MTHRARRKLIGLAAIGTGAATVFGAAVSPIHAGADDNFYPSPNWNGKKIYLSPARHPDTGSRGECQGKSENDMGYSAAYGAANQTNGLVSRQYKVQIGTSTYTGAVANSNSWGADIHLVMHSNSGSGAGTCASRSGSSRGTTVIYYDGSTSGSNLAQKVVDNVGPATPGTKDYKCKNSDPCTSIFPLYELQATSATAAYSETEFHDWNAGVNFLTSSGWKNRFGGAVDQHLGYPRA